MILRTCSRYVKQIAVSVTNFMIFSAQFLFLMDYSTPATMRSSCTSSSSQHGMGSPNFAFTLNQLSVLWRAQPPNWVLFFESSSQQLVLSLQHRTYHLRKQPKDVGKLPKKNFRLLHKNRNKNQKEIGRTRTSHQNPSSIHLGFQTTKPMHYPTTQLRVGNY